jgi:hypothetical protein
VYTFEFCYSYIKNQNLLHHELFNQLSKNCVPGRGANWFLCVLTWNKLFRRQCILVQLFSVTDSHSWEANSLSTIHILHFLWNPKVHYRAHKSSPLVPILSHMHPDHAVPCFPPICRLGLPSGLISSGFPTKILYAFLISPIRARSRDSSVI